MSKFLNVKNTLIEQLDSGKYAPNQRLPTDREFHKELGVNRLTVIKALKALEEEGRVVRRRGSGTYVAEHPPLIPGRTLKLAFLQRHEVHVDYLETNLYGRIVRGALNRARMEIDAQVFNPEKNVPGLHWSCPSGFLDIHCFGEPLDGVSRRPPLEPIRKGHYDGLIVMAIDNDSWLEELLSLNIPTIIVDYPNDKFKHRADHVFFDAIDSYRHATHYFIEKGLTQIHFIGECHWLPAEEMNMSVEEWQKNRSETRMNPDSLMRLSAFRQGMDEKSLGVSDEQVHFTVNGVPQLPNLAKKLASLPKDLRPQALLCHNDSLGRIMQKYLAELDVHVETLGATDRLQDDEDAAIIANDQYVGETAMQLLLTQLKEKQSHHINVGVPMAFRTLNNEDDKS